MLVPVLAQEIGLKNPDSMLRHTKTKLVMHVPMYLELGVPVRAGRLAEFTVSVVSGD